MVRLPGFQRRWSFSVRKKEKILETATRSKKDNSPPPGTLG